MVTFADFALIRRWRDTFPTRGKATAVIPQNLEVAFEFLWIDRIFAPSARPHPSLRATFPTRGKAAFGGTELFDIPLISPSTTIKSALYLTVTGHRR